jgi:hypothetical protein
MVRFSRNRAGSGSFGFPRSLLDLSPLPAGPSRSSRPDHRPQPKPRVDSPHDLILSSRALVRELGSPLGDSSSLEIRSKPVCPPADTSAARPLPEAEAPVGPTVPPAESWSAFVVSHHHDGLLHATVMGLLHPTTGQGFAAFHASRRQRSPKATLVSAGTPRDAVHTLRSCSLANSRTASLRPLPSCRYRAPSGNPPTEAGEPPFVPDRSRARPTTRTRSHGTRSGSDDAPIRRSGPPRHRAHHLVPGRSRTPWLRVAILQPTPKCRARETFEPTGEASSASRGHPSESPRGPEGLRKPLLDRSRGGLGNTSGRRRSATGSWASPDLSAAGSKALLR